MRQVKNTLSLSHNKAFKRDSCRVAFLVCGEFCGESGLQKFGLCGIHPLTRRYALATIRARNITTYMTKT
ncbi:DUF3265 domain-containing protein [Vibrio parahaemolyticus]